MPRCTPNSSLKMTVAKMSCPDGAMYCKIPNVENFNRRAPLAKRSNGTIVTSPPSNRPPVMYQLPSVITAFPFETNHHCNTMQIGSANVISIVKPSIDPTPIIFRIKPYIAKVHGSVSEIQGNEPCENVK